MEEMGNRKADLQSLVITENGRMRLEFMAPSRGLIGFRSQFLTLTSGSGILTSVFDHYGLAKKGEIATRQNGVMVSMITGKTLPMHCLICKIEDVCLLVMDLRYTRSNSWTAF